MAYYGKAAASRIIAGQPLSWAGTGTSFSTKFSGETFQVRVISQINGWVAVLDTTAQMFSTSTLMSTVGSIGDAMAHATGLRWRVSVGAQVARDGADNAK